MNEKLLNKDITIKILSVMLALLLWFYVITEQNPDVTKDITIPVRLINTVFLERSNMVLVNDPSSFKVTLKLKGKTNALDKLNESTVDAFADLEGNRVKGENYLKINISGIPENVEILQKSAETIKVILEPKVSIQKNVQVNIMGNPIQGLAAMIPKTVPNDVVITCAESLANKIKSVRVDVDIAGVNEDIKKILPVRVLDENGKDIQNITVEPANVEVTIPIEGTKRVRLEADISGQPASGYVVSGISLQPKEILIVGEQQILAGINSLKTEKIDIAGETADISKEVKLIMPAGVELANANEIVGIDVNIEKIETREMKIDTIEFVNMAEGLELDSIRGDITATFRGAESLVTDASNIVKFFVDLKDAKEGANVVDVLWESPQGIEVVSVSPQQATVILRKKAIE